MRDTTLATDTRGLSREAVLAIGFGLTVAMMAVVGGVLMQMDGVLTEASAGPTVSTDVDSITAGDGPDDQWVRIQHDSGPQVDAANVTITVWLPEHRKRSTLQRLPTQGIEPDDYDHNHIYTLGERGVEGPISGDSDRTWSASETIGFQIAHDRVALQPGQRVNVTVTHVPSDSKLVDRSLVVE